MVCGIKQKNERRVTRLGCRGQFAFCLMRAILAKESGPVRLNRFKMPSASAGRLPGRCETFRENFADSRRAAQFAVLLSWSEEQMASAAQIRRELTGGQFSMQF